MRSLRYIRNTGINPSLPKKICLCLFLSTFCFIPTDSMATPDSTLSISGAVSYFNDELPVDSVKIRLYGATYKRTFTDAQGRYCIEGIPPSGSFYSFHGVDPDREISDDEPVTAFDASLIFRHVLDRFDLNEYQRLAADITMNQEVSTFDALVILKYICLGGPRHYIDGSLNIGTWSFLPERRIYDPLLVDQVDQDYTGFIIGDVSGNWRREPVGQDSVAVLIPPQTAQPGEYLLVPIFFGGVEGKNIFSGQGAITYNESGLFVNGIVTVDLEGLTYDVDNGRTTMAWAEVEPLSDDGIRLYVDIHVSPDVRKGQSYPLHFEYFMFNEGDPAILTGDGRVSIITIPDIALSSFHHDFGHAVIGDTARWELDISNEGTEQLYINGIFNDNPDFRIDDRTFVVEPGQTRKVTVYCSPTDTGSTVGDIAVCSNDPDEPILFIRLEAVGVRHLAILRIGDGYGRPGSSDNMVPIYLNNDVDVRGLDMIIYYDPEVLEASKVSSTPRSVCMDIFDADLTTVPGRLRLLVADLRSESIVAGTGSVAEIYFNVLNDAPVGAVSLRADEVIIADTRRNSVPVKIEHGRFFVELGYTIAGVVTYFHSDLPVNSVEMVLSGGFDDTTFTDAVGFYQFNSLQAGGDYTITPGRKPDDAPVSALDASLILRYLVHALDLNENQLIVADVTRNGEITAFDASIIMKYTVGEDITGFTHHIGDWSFIPEAIIIDSLVSDHVDQSCSALICGDVSGNWRQPVMMLDTLTISLPETSAAPGETVHVEVEIGDVEEIEIWAVGFIISYDMSVLTIKEFGPSIITEDLGVLAYRIDNGRISSSFAFNTHPDQSGPFAYIIFQVSPDAQVDQTIPLHFEDVMFNEGNPAAVVEDGAVHITEVTGIEEHDQTQSLPKGFALFQNYPNPFNAKTDIRYQIPDSRSPAHSSLKIYNVLGQEVRTLVGEYQDAGYYSITWDGRDGQGNGVPSGVYSYRLSVNGGEWVEVRKMVLVR